MSAYLDTASCTTSFSALLPKILVFEGVRNAVELKSTLPGNYALINLQYVLNEFHLKAAVMKACINKDARKMKTRTLATEVLYQLSPSTNVQESNFNYFHVKEDSSTIAIILFDESQEAGSNTGSFDSSTVQGGTLLDIQELGSERFLTLKKKETLINLFKITAQEHIGSSLEDSIITRLATKDCI